MIDRIKERLSIMEVLTAMGKTVNHLGFTSSIYKDEKTPSMKIYTDSDRFFDFATFNQGDIIQLYQDYYNVTTGEAVKDLAQLAGIEQGSIPERRPVKNEAVKDMSKELDEDERYCFEEMVGKGMDEGKAFNELKLMRIKSNTEIFEKIYSFCKDRLNKKAMDYLINVRKLPLDILDKFKIFTIDHYGGLCEYISTLDQDAVNKSGLLNEKGKLIFYKHRIIIPYLFKGKIVYLRGRYFDDKGNTKSDSGFKYIGLKNDYLGVNTPKRFFNIDRLQSTLSIDKVYIVEGEFDAIAAESIGQFAVAIPGCGNIPNNLSLLNYCNPVICVDSDSAGEGLLKNLSSRLDQLGIAYKIKRMPTKDVNDFIVECANVG